MSYLEELLPEFRKGAKIRMKDWPKPFYYQMRNRKVYNQDGHRVKNFSHQALFKNVWELHKDYEYDWKYIIDNKCLCWFWDDKKENKVADTLEENSDNYKRFISNHISWWKNCRPVRRDEVSFYEDRKDDKK